MERFGGPIRRVIAERIARARPDLVRCSCSVCHGRMGLPPEGVGTIIHNVAVLNWLMASARHPAQALEYVGSARDARVQAGTAIGWHGETGDVDKVARVLRERDATRTLGPLVLAT